MTPTQVEAIVRKAVEEALAAEKQPKAKGGKRATAASVEKRYYALKAKAGSGKARYALRKSLGWNEHETCREWVARVGVAKANAKLDSVR